MRAFLFVLAFASSMLGVDPTFLRRHAPSIRPQEDDLTTGTARYKPIFGIGDAAAAALKGVARYGELTVHPKGSSTVVSYAAEEQVYYILEGSGILVYGGERFPVKRNDFMYLPPGIKHGIDNPSAGPCRLLVMGFKIPAAVTVTPPPKLLIANSDDVELVELGSHGPTSRYKLLMGTTRSTRDKLAAATVMVSLFIMDFAPGGTNIPHHHDNAEEIYYVLRGKGEMVAGGGIEGTEGRHPAKRGDAYFFRLNTTVGFYSATDEGEEHAQILAVRSLYPFRSRDAR